MMLKPQKCSQPKPDVIALRSRLSRRASFYSTKLLDAPMIGLYCPRHILQLHALKLSHFHFVRRPVFNVAVWGYQLEYLNKTIPFQMQNGAELANLDFLDRPVALAIWIDLAITLQLGQPKPSQMTNGFEIIDAAVPAIKQDTGRRK